MSSTSSYGGQPYNHSSISEKYSLSPSPAQWGTPFLMHEQEPDDSIHNPDQADPRSEKSRKFSMRGVQNMGCLTILVLGLLMLFAGYPIIARLTRQRLTSQGGFNLGGINATGQIPELPGNHGLIDKDTPRDVYTKKSWQTDEELVLVFSDEFNEDGRTFYPGDDPFWEAVDLHYWGTNDLEWYDPSQATTSNGSLQITIERVNPADNHNLTYKSGMVQSWNKFCFTGGLIETSVRLPGSNSIGGFWPAVWTMGNLGRAGFGASAEGNWPYTYEECDVGTLPNQTYSDTMTPLAAVTNGDQYNNDMLSYLPGQKLSACTCPGESHPGPVKSDGSYVGRASPEIDIIEATIHDGVGYVSLSGQWAPYNAEYAIFNTSGQVEFFDTSDKIHYNDYVGGVLQQTTSGLAQTNQNAYELNGGQFAVYGFEYKPGYDDAYITWINDNKKAWTIYATAMIEDPRTEISARPMSLEPMYIIANLGFSTNFVANIEFELLTFPAAMSVDWIRVYQPKNSIKIGCDPVDHPTAAYIETYKEAYTNPNHTTWAQFGQPWPKNSLSATGCN
ncbi:hypothetical protein EST38_g9828 [Candolleomyces aberdarensis]|uniref:GH16 domain-containing protein n=1 Tax=Candolleomyces aberdarensis TaxID=2316362 RepID=A0A4Q2D8Y7_9AGAR|nr:hypothetical protein EST38_g9828 [Candolleomyces aberdarensis]